MDANRNTRQFNLTKSDLTFIERVTNFAEDATHFAQAARQAEIKAKAEALRVAAVEFRVAYDKQQPSKPSLPGQRTLPGVDGPDKPKAGTWRVEPHGSSWIVTDGAGKCAASNMTVSDAVFLFATKEAGEKTLRDILPFVAPEQLAQQKAEASHGGTQPAVGEWRLIAGKGDSFAVGDGRIEDQEYLDGNLVVSSVPYFFGGRESAEKAIENWVDVIGHRRNDGTPEPIELSPEEQLDRERENGDRRPGYDATDRDDSRPQGETAEAENTAGETPEVDPEHAQAIEDAQAEAAGSLPKKERQRKAKP